MAPESIVPVAEPAAVTWEAATERLAPLSEWWSMQTGAPPADDEGTWIDYGDLGSPATAQRLTAAGLASSYATSQASESVVGNYIFRDLLGTPLGFMGYLWARERRVPLLSRNAAVNESEWFQHWRWLRPAGVAIAGDPIAGRANVSVVPDVRALNDALFAEVTGFCGPILEAFRKHRYVAPANAWGSILDAIMYGAELAGRADPGLGLDGAWNRWEAAIEGRTFPVRRRPRRLKYEWAPGKCDETLVRAGCCLWYTTPEAKDATGARDYCTSCYLKTDEARIVTLVEWKREEAGGGTGTHQDGDTAS